MSLYKLVTTENVDLNYKAFKKDELIDCILNLRTTYFRLKKENEEINFLGNCYGENARCIDLLIKENQELKKQVEERTKMYQNAYDYSQKMEGKTIILENQQKEFIKYLEDEISKLKEEYGNYVYDDYSEEKGKYDTYIEILQKYKEITGVSDENNIK